MESYFKALSFSSFDAARFDHRSVKLLTMSFAIFHDSFTIQKKAVAGEVSNPVTRRSGTKMATVWMLMVALAIGSAAAQPNGRRICCHAPITCCIQFPQDECCAVDDTPAAPECCNSPNIYACCAFFPNSDDACCQDIALHRFTCHLQDRAVATSNCCIR